MGKDDLVKEDLPFEVPKFNEDEFVRKELIGFRTTVILFVFSLVVAGITFAYWKLVWLAKDLNAGEFMLLLVFSLAAGGALPFIYRAFRVDISHFRRKEWVGTMFLHFIFWLGFTLLLANPPFSDNAAPAIEAYASPAVQGLGGVVNFGAYVGDNEGVDTSSLQFCLREKGNATGACEAGEWTQARGLPVWIRQWTPTREGTYTFTIDAADVNGKKSHFEGTVVIGNPFPKISPVNGATFEDDSRRVAVRPHENLNLRAVMYRIGDRAYNMTAPTEAGGDWTTDPTFPGWTTGSVNVTFLAQEQPRYLQGYKLEGGIAQHPGASRTYTIAQDFQDLNHEKEPQRAENPPPNLVGTPGFEAPLAILGVAVVAIIGLRSRRDGRA